MLSILYVLTLLLTLIESSKVAVYWGQGIGGQEKNLADYCNDTTIDIIVITYLNEFDGLGVPKINLKKCTSQQCAEVGGYIRTCQSKGKKVLLSLGGSVVNSRYNIGSQGAAEKLAQQLYDMFFIGTSTVRPLGSITLDGIDLSVQNKQGRYYSDMVNHLRNLANAGGKKIIITASPGCSLPDINLQEAFDGTQFDYVFVSFFNDNKCETDSNINFPDWDNWAKDAKTKIFLGIAGSRNAVKSGYLPPDLIKRRISAVKKYPSFAGVIFMDASAAFVDDQSDGKILADFTHSAANTNLLNSLTTSFVILTWAFFYL